MVSYDVMQDDYNLQALCLSCSEVAMVSLDLLSLSDSHVGSHAGLQRDSVFASRSEVAMVSVDLLSLSDPHVQRAMLMC